MAIFAFRSKGEFTSLINETCNSKKTLHKSNNKVRRDRESLHQLKTKNRRNLRKPQSEPKERTVASTSQISLRKGDRK